ncbi:MAG TPA: hypothetical protein VK590_04780, partial [Saprospiraceae bacterium]|nr:hypothetical protein [Saprospiraceae bacterium]
LDSSGLEVLTTWGPRPFPASEIAWDWKNNMDKISWIDFQNRLHLWYAKDKGKTTIKEITDLLRR